MVDFLSPTERSERMSRIRGKDTKPELTLRKVLHGLGLRYRLHGAGLPGKPDLVFPRYKVVVFVHGCFWRRLPVVRTEAVGSGQWLHRNRDREVDKPGRRTGHAAKQTFPFMVRVSWGETAFRPTGKER